MRDGGGAVSAGNTGHDHTCKRKEMTELHVIPLYARSRFLRLLFPSGRAGGFDFARHLDPIGAASLSSFEPMTADEMLDPLDLGVGSHDRPKKPQLGTAETQ